MHPTRFALIALTTLLLPARADAQHVMADIRIGDGPVAARVILGHPGRHEDRFHRSHDRGIHVVLVHRRPEWFRRHGFRAVHVWHDRAGDRYTHRYHSPRNRLREVVIYERAGRYYRPDWRREDGRDHDRDERAAQGHPQHGNESNRN